MRRRRHRAGLALVGAATVLAGVLGAVGPASAATSTQPGLTAKSITVGQVDTLSGPVPGLFEGAENGTKAYLAYVNSTGGVNGRKILLDVQDDAFSGANYTTETQQLVNSTFALVGGFSLFDASGVPAINAAKIPDITESLSAARNLDQYNYSPDPLIPGATRLGPFEYYKKEYPGAITHVGTLFSNVATAETQSVTGLHRHEVPRLQGRATTARGPFETDFTPDVLKMRAAGVQMVVHRRPGGAPAGGPGPADGPAGLQARDLLHQRRGLRLQLHPGGRRRRQRYLHRPAVRLSTWARTPSRRPGSGPLRQVDEEGRPPAPTSTPTPSSAGRRPSCSSRP